MVFFFLVIALIGFTQTKTFRNYLRSLAVSQLQTVVNGTITLGAIEGNLGTGFQVNGVSITQNGIEVFSAERLEARYDLLGLFVNRIAISRLTLLRPTIRLWRGTDHVWNTATLIRPQPSADTSAAPLSLAIGQLDILGASFTLVDSASLQERTPEEWAEHPRTAFDYSNIALSPLTLKASVLLRGKDLHLTVRTLSFESARPRFVLSDFSGDFSLHPDNVEIQKLTIRTPGSSLILDAKLADANIFSIDRIQQLEQSPVELSLTADRLDFGEFKQFLPGPVDFLDRRVALQVDAQGTFGRLRIEDVQVRSPRTYINIHGSLSNLHNPRALALDLSGKDNVIHPADALELVPGLRLPDLRFLGVLECNLMFKGTPQNFSARVDGQVNAGQFDAKADLDLRSPSMVYKADVSTIGLNLASLLHDPSLPSDINTHTTISGSGTALREMTSLLRTTIDSSMVAGLPVSNSVLVTDIADGILRTNLLVNVGSTRIDLSGQSHFFRADSSHYTLQGKIYSLNLADLLRNKRYDSAISFDLGANGSLRNSDIINTGMKFHFLRSSFGTDTFQDRHLSIDYNHSDSLHSMLKIRSDVADLDVTGTFTPVDFVSTFERGSTLLAEAISHRFATLDSLGAGTRKPRTPFRSRLRRLPESLDAQFSVNLKNAYPLGAFLGVHMAGHTSVEGAIDGSLNDLHLAGKGTIGQFALRTGSTRLRISDGAVTFALGHLGRVRTLETLQSSVTFSTPKAEFDSLGFSDIRVFHQLTSDSSAFTASAVIDSTVGIDVAGTSVFVPNLINLELSKLNLRVANYQFENPDSIELTYGRDGIQVHQLSLQHEAENLSLEGILNPAGVSDLRFSVENFLIKNLRDFSRNEAYVEKVRDFNGVLDMNGTFTGNFEVPKFQLSLTAQGVTLGSTVFGQISGRGGYADGVSTMFLEFRNNPESPAPPEFLVSGTMPMKLGAVTPAQSNQGMNLLIQSRGFRLEFLDPFLPITKNLTGSILGDIRMKGTLKEPSYEGSLTIDHAQFLFTPLGITYNLNGDLVPQNQRINLRNMVLSNIPDDRVPGLLDGLGSMKLDGNLILEGLRIKSFDLTTNGQLLIMKESARQKNFPVFGNMYVGTGTTPLRWNGTPEQSYVTGDVLVKNANITFPPTRSVKLERSRLFTVTFVNDTLKTGKGKEEAKGSTPKGTGGNEITASLSSSDGLLPPLEPQPAAQENKSFLDNISYDLTIETAGLTQVRFVFNQLTNEELFADLKGRLVFAKDESASRLTGELEVGPRSYYKYFKTLQATGKLLFTGDFSNPELNIVATYEGLYHPAAADTNRIGISEQDKQDKKVVVRLDISGTREEPKVKMGLDVYDLDGNKLQQRPDAQSDAIAFLISGTFKDEMTQGQQNSLLSVGLLSSIGSSLLSGPLTEFVRNQIGYITSVDVVYYGGATSFDKSADIRLTGEVGDAVIRLGGRVFNDIANTNVSIQFPMSSVIGSEAWRNLILELERRVEAVESIDQRRLTNGVRLLYRITF